MSILLIKRLGLGLILSSLLFFILMFLVTPYVRTNVLEEYWEVQPAEKVKQTEWLERFEETALYSTIVAALGSVGWLTFSSLWYRIESWRGAGGRGSWLLLGATAIVAVVLIAVFRTPPTVPGDGGDTIAILYLFVAALILYWVPTATASPPSVKYAPLLAKHFGRLGNWALGWI